MGIIKKVLVLTLAVVAVIVFPLGVITFFAEESALTQVILYDGDERREFLVGAETVGGFLHEAGIPTGTADRLSHAQSALLWDGIEITIEREIAFYVQKDGNEPMQRFSPPGISVAEAHRQLQQQSEIALIFGGDMDAPVENGDVLRFNTWRTRYETDHIPLPYETIRNRTSSVSQGREHLRVVGEYGEKAITTSVLYIGGFEDNREVVLTEILLEPIDAILDIGTGWLGALADVTAPDFHYFRRVRMEATAYTAGYCCTGKHPDDPWYGITASGRRVEHGIVAVDRNVIPLGTRLYVENYGFAIAADVGGAIRGYKIDLYMTNLEDALRFGRRHIYVWILDEIQ
jgi:3D (Asp-Asp-Asp) domain-containing protein